MPSPVRFAEIRKRLERAGYRLVRVSGSHHIFDRPGGPLVSVPVHNQQVKAFYAREVDKIIEANKARRAGEQVDKPAEGGRKEGGR
jgi:predicted RNA binding protein YcfA (HicA-like mRNA interferase family)